ncbi:MAG: hypothetical protein K8I82_03110 [Anaerolineae bacterium]|nr:hypothetical protein [Anaerolineae bacterium]
MSEQIYILWDMDNDAIRWQNCAICGQQKQRIIHTPGAPDFAVCDNCQSAFVQEKGGKMRVLYAKIPLELAETSSFALRKWRTYFEVRVQAEREKTGKSPEELPAQLKSTSETAVHGKFATASDAYLDLEAQKSELLYERQKKTQPPPRQLKQTGELPPLDDLFEDL